jgi:hypothetical protein
MKGRAGRKGLGFRAYFICFGGGELPFPPYTNESQAIRYPPMSEESSSHIIPSVKLEGGEDQEEGTVVSPRIYHYDPIVYQKFKDEDWINKDIHHILFLRGDGEVDIDKEFYKKSYLLFGLGAILAPSILSELIKNIKTEESKHSILLELNKITKSTKTSESNRNIRIILGLIGCIPQNKPYQNKQDWNFHIPEKVIEIYKKNGVQNYRPNWFAYQWLMNQKNDFSFSEKEECIKNGKYWSYLFFLLSPIFRKILGENKGDELYNDIQGLITNSIINM